MPGVRGEVVTIFRPEETTMVKSLESLCFGSPESSTFAVNVNVPAADGVPLMMPPLLSATPPGRSPDVRLQVYGAFPPDTFSVSLYAVPSVPGLRGDVVTICSSGETVIENPFDVPCFGLPESSTFTANVNVPEEVGVPLIAPAAVRLRPPGRLPDRTLHVYGVDPPDAVNATEYGAPTAPAASRLSEVIFGPEVKLRETVLLSVVVPDVPDFMDADMVAFPAEEDFIDLV